MAEGNDKDAISYTRLDARTAAVLEQRVVSLESNIQSLVKSMEKLDESFERLTKALTQSEKTNWPLFISILAVSMTLFAGVGWVWLRPFETRIERIENNRFSTQDPSQNIQIEQNKQEIERLRNRVNNAP
jgi:HAMP domain-containing protein